MISFGGDFRFFWLQNIKDFASFPSAWDSSLNTGLGQPQLSSLWITSYFNLTALFSKLGLDWNMIQILFWVIPAFVLSFLSSFLLFNYFFKDKKSSVIAGIIYSLNTYFLMIITGGQLGVSLAYSLTPLILLRFIKLFKDTNIENSILVGFLLSLQIIFDPRITYLNLVLVFMYFIFNFWEFKTAKKLLLLVPFIFAFFLNFYWILPLLISRSSVLPVGFDSSSGFKFLSFANFSNGFSLLHPNWPENIFGKVYFLDPKFLILPVIAFSSLLFKKNKIILQFCIFALLGIILAKGANPPFGEVNMWVFLNVPGMSMFRDPTKWYLLIALSYSLLIPYSLKNLSKYFRFAPLLFVIYFLFLITPIFSQIKIKEVPHDYVLLKDLLAIQKYFFRTLWIPKWQRFGYFSNNHPAIGREELLSGNSNKQIRMLNQKLLEELSVKYIIVPYDSQSEIFLKDRKYNPKEYEDTVRSLEKIKWLKEVNGFNSLKVFELSNQKDHFWSPSASLKISYQFFNPSEYKVKVHSARKGDLLIFTDSFDKNWFLVSSDSKVRSSDFDKMNSFKLQKDGNYELKIQYEPQKYLNTGMLVSLISLIFALGLFKFGNSLKKW